MTVAASSGFAGKVIFDGRGGDDILTAGTGAAQLIGGDGNDQLRGGGGNDTLQGGVGDDVLTGGAGTDKVDESTDTNVVIDSSVARQLVSPGLGSDQWVTIEQLQLTGGAGANLFDARKATIPATLIGGDGNDTLLGSSAADNIQGGNGNDVISGAAATDLFDGGADNDAVYEKANVNFTISLSSGVNQISSSATGTEKPTKIEQFVVIGDDGEFGRTPRINATAGRDHWAPCYTQLLAGGGVRGGQIYGASDGIGAFVKDLPVTPDDYMATILHAFGYAPESAVYDQLNRPQRISLGTPVTALF